MYRFIVVDVVAGSRLVALCDDAGRYHVAHCTSDLPNIRHELIGDLPSMGFALLIDDAGVIFRLIYSQVNCGQRFVFDQLHQPANGHHA